MVNDETMENFPHSPGIELRTIENYDSDVCASDRLPHGLSKQLMITDYESLLLVADFQRRQQRTGNLHRVTTV